VQLLVQQLNGHLVRETLETGCRISISLPPALSAGFR